jgi:hypothetical protein
VSHPTLTRVHLEAVLIARAVLDPAVADDVDETRLSPAALALLHYAADDNVSARASVLAGAVDEFSARLAQRVERLTIADLTFWPLSVQVALVNQLPRLGTRPTVARRVA